MHVLIRAEASQRHQASNLEKLNMLPHMSKDKYDSAKDFEKGRLPCIIWMDTVQSQESL